MSVRWVAVAFVLFAGGWGVGFMALPLVDHISTPLLAVWCFGALSASYLTCRSGGLRIREATAGALLMGAAISGIHAIFPEVSMFAPPAALGSWVAVAAMVFAASLAGAYLGGRSTAVPGRLALAGLGALALTGVVVVLGLTYAAAAFLVPSFAIGFIFVFALLGAPALAGVICVVALGDRSRAAIIGGSIALAILTCALVAVARVASPIPDLAAILFAAGAIAMTSLLVALIGLAGVELGYHLDLKPRAAEDIPRATIN